MNGSSPSARILSRLFARVPLLRQIVDEQRSGIICADPSGSVLDANARARALARLYGRAGSSPAAPRALADLARAAASAHRSGRQGVALTLPHPDGLRMLEVCAHLVGHDQGAPRALLVILAREVDLPRRWTPHAEALLSQVPPRQKQVANLLVHTGLSYKEMADVLGIQEGTVRVHVRDLYRALRVDSRPNLVKLLRG